MNIIYHEALIRNGKHDDLIFFDHVLQNYPELIAYALRRNGNTVHADDILHNRTFVIGGKEYPVSVKMLNPEVQKS